MRNIVGQGLLEHEITRFRRSSLQRLAFPHGLEEQFERETAKQRAHRLWSEGLFAIIAFNGCLLLDLFLIRDTGWKNILFRTMLITPLALLINLLVRRNPRRWLREGSVALGTALICFISVHADGNATVATTIFGLMSVLLMVLFADVVMRLRLLYAIAVTVILFAGGLAFVLRAAVLQHSEKVVGASLLSVGVAITLAAGYSLERQERLSYLLFLRGALQAEELARLNSVLLELSTLDKLTGLPNRRAFDDSFEKLWNENQRSLTQLSAILVDVDHFKIINDVVGHLYGDQVLQRIALLLPRALRSQGDLAARFGGEEFVVLLPNTSEETALVVAERIRSLIEVAGTPVTEKLGAEPVIWVTVSCGVATCTPSSACRPTDLLQAADQALYGSKAGGRNRVSHRETLQRFDTAPSES